MFFALSLAIAALATTILQLAPTVQAWLQQPYPLCFEDHSVRGGSNHPHLEFVEFGEQKGMARLAQLCVSSGDSLVAASEHAIASALVMGYLQPQNHTVLYSVAYSSPSNVLLFRYQRLSHLPLGEGCLWSGAPLRDNFPSTFGQMERRGCGFKFETRLPPCTEMSIVLSEPS